MEANLIPLFDEPVELEAEVLLPNDVPIPHCAANEGFLEANTKVQTALSTHPV